MIGNGYWSTGITLTPDDVRDGHFQWDLSLDYYDDGWVDHGWHTTEGTLRCRYSTASVVAAARGLVEDAKRLGIRFDLPTDPKVYVADELASDLPNNWRDTVQQVADALGFECPYRPSMDLT